MLCHLKHDHIRLSLIGDLACLIASSDFLVYNLQSFICYIIFSSSLPYTLYRNLIIYLAIHVQQSLIGYEIVMISSNLYCIVFLCV